MKTMKQLGAFLLAIAMFVTALPLAAKEVKAEVTGGGQKTRSVVNEGAADEADKYTVTFAADENATINVYYSQDYTDKTERNYEENVTTAYARTKAGVITTVETDKPQVNFEVVCAEGYELDEIVIEPIANCNGYKGSSDTGVEGIYRITKIKGDITVTVTTKKSAESVSGNDSGSDSDGGNGEETEKYSATFVTDKNAAINVYYSQDYTDKTESNYEENAATAYARTKNGVISTAEGDKPQINFEVVCAEGYQIEAIEISPEDNYNEIKGSSDTGVEGIYRITKIAGDITVNVTTKAVSDGGETEKFTAEFVTDENVTINVYYSKEYADKSAGNYEENVTTAYARTEAGVISTVGVDKPQVNFEAVCADGYEIDTIEIGPEENYNALKGSIDTGVEGIYRITKVTGDITVTITTKKADEAGKDDSGDSVSGNDSGDGKTEDDSKTTGDSETANTGKTSDSTNTNTGAGNTTAGTGTGSAAVENEKTINGITYTLKSGKAVVTAADSSLKTVTIPAAVTLNGKSYPVTQIAANVFKNHTKLKKVTIGANITIIGNGAFYNCKNLKTVIFKGKTVPRLGSKAFKNISKKAVFKVVKASKEKNVKKLQKKSIGYVKTWKIK